MPRSHLSPALPRVIGETSPYQDLSRYNAAPRHRYVTIDRDDIYCCFCRQSVPQGTVAVRFPPKWATRHLECKSPKRKPWKVLERL